MSDRFLRLLRWPLWSWRNLTISALGLILLLAGVGRVSAVFGTGEAVATTTRSATPSTATSPSDPTPVASSPATRPAVASPETPDPIGIGSCEQTAVDFLRAWARPAAKQKWLPGMQPYATHQLLDQLRTTDASSVPASKVLGRPKVKASNQETMTVRILTDAGRVDLVLRRSDSTCLVEDLQPVNDVPGAPTPELSAHATGTGS